MPPRLTVVLVSLLLATPAVIFWFWLVVPPATVAILCPEECTCDPSGYFVMCYKSLNNIPLIFPPDVRLFRLFDNNITSLEKDSFISRGLTELVELSAGKCGFETLELGAFNGLTKLKYLFMWGNEISEITPGTFQPMSRLQTLVLSDNRIERLEVGVFSGLVNLKYIELMSNKLQYLHPDTFVGLPNLEHLNLAQNPDLHVPTEHNFINSHSLSRLQISFCIVSSVSVETFANVTALELLDLSYNNLSSVDINILKALPKLSALYLSGNPLHCDCQLREVWRWCQEHNIETALWGRGPECDTPSEVQGMWWGVLEKAQCLLDFLYVYLNYNDSGYSRGAANNPYGQAYDSRYSFLQHYEVPIYAVPFIFGTTGNVILLIIIICNKHMRTVPNMYILNLAISDMIYLMVFFSEACADRISDRWQVGDIMCRFFQFCRRLSVGLSVYSVAVLSIQRYRVTVNPLHVRVSSQPTWRATAATICGVWIVAALFALPSALSKDLCQKCYGTGCLNYYKNVVLFQFLVSCVLPLCVIAFSYIMTARHLLKSARPISEETQNHQLNTRTNTAKIVLGLTAVFLISYVPYHIFWTNVVLSRHVHYDGDDIIENIYTTSNFKTANGYTYFVSTCLLLINPSFNPVALFCTGRAFRRQFKRYLTCCCKANPTGAHIQLERRN